MMKFCFASMAALLVWGTLSVAVSSFQPCSRFQRNDFQIFSANQPDAETVTYFDDLVKAVRASTTFGLCDSDELHELADKVEAGASTCIFEVEGEGDDGFLCQKEINDRMDVAEVLRMQADLQLRMEAIRGSSLFAGDCLAEDAIRQRDDLINYLGQDSL
jgi:hypothetical protein